MVAQLQAPLAAQLERDHGDWQPLLQRWRDSAAGQATLTAVDKRLASRAVVYPPQVFRAMVLTPMASTKVVILGQDPYHGPEQAEGLAFSVSDGQPAPPSLRNIFKELTRDLGLPRPASTSLAPWSERGVLLLNTSLTVEQGRAGSHAKLGWQVLTDAIVEALWADAAPKVFLLWGAHAQGRLPVPRSAGPHAVLHSNHPSPLSALRSPLPFIGNGHFGDANLHLVAHGRAPVDWLLP